MEQIIQFIADNAQHAHWYIFVALLLAGFNLPISIDATVVISAIIASSFVPENTKILYLTVLCGCSLSAWIAYTIGRIAGQRLSHIRPFSYLMQPERIQKIESFYQKWGLWAFIAGRFIPFGVRNCMFLTSGMSKMPFRRFMARDALGCLIWTATLFSFSYLLGQNKEIIWKSIKTFNIVLFTAFSVTVISVIWYKKKKKTETTL